MSIEKDEAGIDCLNCGFVGSKKQICTEFELWPHGLKQKTGCQITTVRC